jgi:regulatory protein
MQGKRKDPYYQAQDILSRRDHSEAEVRTKLAKKGLPSKTIDDVIVWLYDKKLLDDAAYAEKYVESVVRVKAVGPRWLEHKLRSRGVEQSVIAAALTQAFPEGREHELMCKAAESWKRLHPKHKDDTQRLTRFLLSRGFSPHSVREYVE